MQAISLIAIVSLGGSALWTANDPFVGKWRLDVSRSTIVDQMRVLVAGDKYSFNFEGAPVETVIANGTDQPGLPGTTLAVTNNDLRSLTVVRKQGGRVIVSAHWKLSQDGRTLRDAFTNMHRDGSALTVDYLYKRTSGTTGFAGVWESTTKPKGLKIELEIRPYESKGFTFVSSGPPKPVVFKGREHGTPGPENPATQFGWRRGPRLMGYSESSGGKVARTRKFQLSGDGRTLTETLRMEGQTIPDVLVFERE